MLTANQTAYEIRGQTFRNRAKNKPKQNYIPRKAHKKGRPLTAGQRTYEDKTARKAYTKRGQTLRSRANNILSQKVARNSK